MNDRPFDQPAHPTAGFPAGGGPVGDWLREAAGNWQQPAAAQGPPPGIPQGPHLGPPLGPPLGPSQGLPFGAPNGGWPRYERYDPEPPRSRLSAGGAAPWLVAGLLAALLIVNRSGPPEAAPTTPLAAGLPTAAVESCAAVPS